MGWEEWDNPIEDFIGTKELTNTYGKIIYIKRGNTMTFHYLI
jgi:hypothetical protein